MSKACKKYADNHQKNPRWRKFNGMAVGQNKFTPHPSKHALARKNKSK